MEYNLTLLIFANKIMALDYNSTNNVNRISIYGNESCTVQDKATLHDFYECLLEYYNIDHMSDLNIRITMIRFDASEETVSQLYKRLTGAAQIDIIDYKMVLPFLFLKKHIKLNVPITVDTLEFQFRIMVMNDGKVTSVADSSSEQIIVIEPEEYVSVNQFQLNTLSEEDLNALEKKYEAIINIKENEIQELKLRYDKQTKIIQSLKNKKNRLLEEVEKAETANSEKWKELSELRRNAAAIIIVRFSQKEHTDIDKSNITFKVSYRTTHSLVYNGERIITIEAYGPRGGFLGSYNIFAPEAGLLLFPSSYSNEINSFSSIATILSSSNKGVAISDGDIVAIIVKQTL